MYASQYFPQISELLRRLPRVILLMLKTNDCLRAVNNSLVFSTFLYLISLNSLFPCYLDLSVSLGHGSVGTKYGYNKELIALTAAWQLQGSSLETFLIIGRVSSEAVVEAKMTQMKSLFSRIDIWFEEFLFKARLLALQMAFWLLRVRNALAWTPIQFREQFLNQPPCRLFELGSTHIDSLSLQRKEKIHTILLS